MNSNFEYIGKVTLKMLHKGKTICTQHLNSGTDSLFKAYAKALSGQDITSYLPSYINIGFEDGDEFTSLLRNTGGISVVRTYTEQPIPSTRITITLTSSMFNTNAPAGTDKLQLRLLNKRSSTLSEYTLAKVTLDDNATSTFKQVLGSSPSGTQIIIVWDLCVENKVSQNTLLNVFGNQSDGEENN